jgi:PAS domain-containing protein
VETLGANEADIAFAAIYFLEGQDNSAQLVVAKGIDTHDASLWPLAETARHGTPLGVEGLAHIAHRLGLPADRAPDRAVLVPLTSVGTAGAPAVLVVGVNPRRPYDDSYRDFLRLAGGQIGAAINQARFREEERRAIKREAALGAEAALSARRLATVLGSISDTYASFDREWRFASVNRRSIELLSLRVEDVIGKRLWTCSRSWRTPFHDAALRAVEENIITRVEYSYPVGSDRWLSHASIRPPTSHAGDDTDLRAQARRRRASYARAPAEAVAQLGREALLGNDLGLVMDLATSVVADTLGDARSMVLEFLPESRQLRLCAGTGWQRGLIGRAIVDGDPARSSAMP